MKRTEVLVDSQLSVSCLLRMKGYRVDSLTIPAPNNGSTLDGVDDCESGDLISAIQLDSGRFRVVVADLEGKGNGAQPYHEILRCKLAASVGKSAVDYVTDVHNAWHGERFGTVAVLDVDTSRHQAELVSAAHLPAVIKAPMASACRWRGVKLGLVGAEDVFGAEDVSRKDLKRSFSAGGRCVLVSDGVVEAGIDDGEMFGMDRLVETVNQTSGGSQTAQALATAAFEHCDPRVPLDDLTVVVVSRR